MRTNVWSGKVPAYLALVAVAGGLAGCKSLSERYIALEVWKYERCFGHLPPGFTPAGAAAAPGRVCGQGAPCQPACQPSPAPGCDPCQGGAVVDGGMAAPAGLPAGVTVPAGPGGSPGPAAPAGGGFTAGKPVVISDEVVMP